MSVLYLTYDGLLDPLGQSQILPYLYKLQAQLNLTFHIISFEKKERRKDEPALRQTLDQHNMRWYPLPFSRRPPLLAKAYDSWRFFQLAHAITRRENIRFIHARSYVAGWVAHRLSQRYGLPWLFDMRGFWADEKRETGAWRAGHPFYDWLYATWKGREQLMLQSATHVVVLTEAARAVLREWGIPSHKITVIPCVADYDHFRPHPEARATYRTRLNIPQTAFVLGYVGSIGPLYQLDEMLKLFRVLMDEVPESYMVFFTPGSEAEIQRTAAAHGIPVERLRVSFVPRSQLPQWSAVIDMSVIFYREGFSRKGTSPTRIAELLAMNIPVIAQSSVGDMLSLAHTVTGLYLCDTLSEKAYKAVIHSLLKDKAQGKWQTLRTASEPLLSLTHGYQLYRAVYETL